MTSTSHSGPIGLHRRTMRRAGRQIELGRRWLGCGLRLFARNPWLLGGMGFSGAAIVTLLALIPVVGGAMVALVAPIFLASTYLTVDQVARQKMTLPAALRLAALQRAPLELVGIVRRDDKLMPVLLVSICTMGIALLINLLAQVSAGGAWIARWSTLDLLPMLGVLLTALVALSLYAVVAMLLAYMLALSVLQDEPLVPAMRSGIKAGTRYPFAVLFILGLLFLPFLAGTVLSPLGPAIQYLVWILGGGVVLPIACTSLYCSYRNLLTTGEHSAPR